MPSVTLKYFLPVYEICFDRKLFLEIFLEKNFVFEGFILSCMYHILIFGKVVLSVSFTGKCIFMPNLFSLL